MLGESVYDAKGKKNRTKGDVLDANLMKVDVPELILNHCVDVVLVADVVHANNVLFFDFFVREHALWYCCSGR